MTDFHYNRDTNRFFSLGMDLNRPADQLKELKYKLLKNVRSYQTGRLEPRQGLTTIGAVSSAVHSIRRLNAPRTGLWTRIIGNGFDIHTGQTSFTQVDGSYSGDPLAMVPYRPPQSPDPWMYCMDSARQRKIDVAGNVHQVGMPPPTLPLLVSPGAPHFKQIFPPVMSLSGWDNGPPFVCTFPFATPQVNTTISSILYDTSVTGWCLIQPGVTNGIGESTLLQVGSETVVARNIITGSAASTAIAAISYLPDAVTASIVFSTLTNGLFANSLLENTTKGQFARVVAVVDGPGGVQTVLCKPPTTWEVGDTVWLRSSFRCYTAATHIAAEAILNTSLNVNVNATADPALPLTGWMHSPRFVPALDLSQITSSIASTPDSYISINLSLQNPLQVNFGRIMFSSVDTNDPVAAFANDYFYKEFTPQELSGNATTTGTGTATVVNRAAGTSTQITTPGTNSVLSFKLAELVPVGAPSLKNITYIQIELTVISPTDFQKYPISRIYFGSFFLAGEPGPDTGTLGADYLYRYRARCSSTGVVSNWSPATREGFRPNGESITLLAPVEYGFAAEADMLDFQRRGGSIPDNWYYVGSVANTGTPTAFIDKYADDVIIANPSEDQIHYQLWPVLGAAVSGTLTNVAGVIVTGTGFSTTWAPLTPILIAGTWYTIYQVDSATQLELFESAGSQSAVAWEIQEPILQAQTFPCFWGPLDDTLFGCGDPVNPQRLYWTNKGDADTTQLVNWKDITSPSEPLMNGVVYNGRCYAWSSERFFHIIPASGGGWDYLEIPNGRGLWARWAFTSPQSVPGEVLYFLGKDGIYVTDGGSPADITAEDMRPLFPNEGNMGVNVNGVPAPWMTPEFNAQFRLAYYDDYLYFEYPDATSKTAKGGAFTDSLNNWADAWANNYNHVGTTDSLNNWLDGIAFYQASNAIASDSLNTWSDAIAHS